MVNVLSFTPQSITAQTFAQASATIKAGKVLCLPTDTVYGVGADPFSAAAVTRLLAAKSRTREMPPPVLIASWEQGAQLVDFAGEYGQLLHQAGTALARQFWPGALTMILPARAEVGWDLGETHGTVALRMPNWDLTLRLLQQTGPLAVTSANKTGNPPALTIEEAVAQLQDAVSLYLDGGPSVGGVPSTIVKLGVEEGKIAAQILRSGAIEPELIWKTLNSL